MSTTTELKRAVAPATARKQLIAETKKPGTMLDVVRSKSFQSQMALAMPRTMTPERLTRIVMTECRKTPELLSCSQESFYGAILQCAQLGLEPGAALGHCYLLPFGNGKDKSGRPNAQLIIGYRGMLDLARRSGQIQSINAYVVREEDEFSYQLGLRPDIHHVPASVADRGALTYVYAVAVLNDGGVQFEVMSRAEIEAVRKQSKAGTKGPWVTHFDEMARKTVIRRLFKYLPVSIEAIRAVEVDERTDRGEAISADDVIDGVYTDKGVEMQAPEITDRETVDADTGEVNPANPLDQPPLDWDTLEPKVHK